MVVVVRPRLARARIHKRMLMRAACTHLSCAKSHWWCNHAKAVTSWCAVALGAGAVAAGLGSRPPEVMLVDVAGAPEARRCAGRAHPDCDDRYSDESRWRGARNMLPCSGEIAQCGIYDELADMGRADGSEVILPTVLFEDRCFKCSLPFQAVDVKNTGGVLKTLRGRIPIRQQRWRCACGVLVPYDGAQDGLFASTPSTVFTRTFMDGMAEISLTGHSTLSASTGVMCFLLESTGSLCGAREGLTRQTLIIAMHRYSRTLIAPASLFHCRKCYNTPQRLYRALITVGEVLLVQRNQSQALMRVEQDVSAVPMDFGLGACLPNAGLRGAIRRRTTMEREGPMPLTVADKGLLSSFEGAAVGDPDPHGNGAVLSLPRNVAWAAAFLFFSFYNIVPAGAGADQPFQPGGDAATDAAPVGSGADQDEAPAVAGGAALGAGPDEEGARVRQVGDDGNGDAGGGGAAAVHGGGDGQGCGAPGGGAAEAAAQDLAPQEGYVCVEVEDAVGVCNDDATIADRWSTVRDMQHSFLAEPVLGALARLKRQRIRRLALKMIATTGDRSWMLHVTAVESVGILSPFLLFTGRAEVIDPLRVSAVGELLLFACDIDANWETLSRRKVTPEFLVFEQQWRATSEEKYSQ